MPSCKTSPQISCSSHERPWQLISVPTISMTIPLGWMGSPNEKGAGATAGAAGRTGIVSGNKRNRRCGRCSERFSLRSGHRHVRLLLALVGELGEPRALGGSDGGGLLCHGEKLCSRLCTQLCGRVVLVIFVPCERSAPMCVMLLTPVQ